MHVIYARNVHEALPEAVYQMSRAGRMVETRNGTALRYPMPVTTVYEKPMERVLFWPERDANPFFHFYEGLWMLSGANDVASLARFVKRIAMFSDNGTTFHGAYGHRWRVHFGFDQLPLIATRLREGHEDRRQVLQIWDCDVDLTQQAGMRDLPCNLMVMFSVEDGKLDMMVCNRSNDIIWGCYGANAVHFSMLQEVMAAWVGVPVGVYRQVSNNWHAYVDTYEKVRSLAQHAVQPPHAGVKAPNPYDDTVVPYPMVNGDIHEWMSDLAMFMAQEGQAAGYRDVFFRRVALPIVRVHRLYRELASPSNYHSALDMCKDIVAMDWRMACEQWLQRRLARWEAR